MKIFFYAISAFILTFSVAQAEEEYVSEAVDLQELADRMNVIKPQERVKLERPSREFAHETAKKIDNKEAQMLISGQNRVNRHLARRLNEPEPEKLNIDPNNTKEIEKLLMPDLYTYDDLPK